MADLFNKHLLSCFTPWNFQFNLKSCLKRLTIRVGSSRPSQAKINITGIGEAFQTQASQHLNLEKPAGECSVHMKTRQNGYLRHCLWARSPPVHWHGQVGVSSFGLTEALDDGVADTDGDSDPVGVSSGSQQFKTGRPKNLPLFTMQSLRAQWRRQKRRHSGREIFFLGPPRHLYGRWMPSWMRSFTV